MGRASRTKWERRVASVAKARSVRERLRLLVLYALHPKFRLAAKRAQA
jgi:hypothetical protein